MDRLGADFKITTWLSGSGGPGVGTVGSDGDCPPEAVRLGDGNRQEIAPKCNREAVFFEPPHLLRQKPGTVVFAKP